MYLLPPDRTVRTYKFPDLTPQFVLGAHRAAVNVVSISKTLIVSGSGDRSIRLWDAATGKLLRTFENHHTRGYVSYFLTSSCKLS
jgi:F-box and WD-40 domain protein 1/11